MTAEIFWGLPGPRQFLEEAASKMLSSTKGVLAISVPNRRPAGMTDALETALRDHGGGRIINVRADNGLFARSIAHGLARAAGLAQSGISSVADLVTSPEIAAATFLVDGIDLASWPRWAPFIKNFATETQNAALPLAPTLAVCIPGDLPRPAIRQIFGDDDILWRNVVSSIDTRIYVNTKLGQPGKENLVEKIAREIIVQASGWDLALADALCDRPSDEVLYLNSLLPKIPVQYPGYASWANGMIDEWDGILFVHSQACRNVRDHTTILRRTWNAYSRVVNPFLGEVTDFITAEYAELVEDALPYRTENGGKERLITVARDLEIGHLARILAGKVEPNIEAFLKAVHLLRNAVAHYRLPEANVLNAASNGWEIYGRHRDGHMDWHLPRCGQKIVMTFGARSAGERPAGSLLTDASNLITAASVTEILRQEGGQAVVSRKEELSAMLKGGIRRLQNGHHAFIEVNGLSRNERVNLLKECPTGYEIVYEIHGMPEIQTFETSRARRIKELFPAEAATVMSSEVLSVLQGDNQPRVKVVDLRA